MLRQVIEDRLFEMIGPSDGDPALLLYKKIQPGPSERDGKKVAGCDGQSNSKRCRALR